MLVQQLTTHQHGCKAEVCILMGIALLLIIPRRRRHLSFGSSLFQKVNGVDKEVACVSILTVHSTEVKDTYMFETALKFSQNYVLYRTGIFLNVMQEIKVHFCNLVVNSLKIYIDLQYIPKLR